MRKNRLFILGIFTVMVALVSLSLVSGTWAKYTSSVSGSDSARVAKWAFTYDAPVSGQSTGDIKFDLFNTIKDSNGTDAETDVAANLIAPGTSGSFVLTFTNASEVTAEYAIAFDVDKKGVPLEFKVGDGAWETDLADVDASDATKLAYTGAGRSASITIYWRWAFEQTGNVTAGDGVDTGLGSATTLVSPTVSAEVTFTQVD